MSEKHRYLKYLAEAPKTPTGLTKLSAMAEISKSLTKLSRPYPAWKPSYLASKPKFWSGVGDAFNVYGYFKPRFRFREPHQVDTRALYEDWTAIGTDLARAIQRAERAKELSGQARLFDPTRLDKGA